MNQQDFPPPSSMTMTVEIAFLDSNVVKTRVDRAMKIEKNFNCPPTAFLFGHEQIVQLGRNEEGLVSLFLFFAPR